MVETNLVVPTLRDFMEADAGVVTYSVWVKVTSVILSVGILLGGGLAFTRNGSPNTLLYDLYLERYPVLQQQLPNIRLGYAEAVRSAAKTGKYTRDEILELPVFFVFRTGPLATPEIWKNDALAMSGIDTKGGAPAPNILNYLKGINETNRPEAMAWAVQTGVTSVLGKTERDEYPYASVLEGGGKPWLRVAEVDRDENRLQGRLLLDFYGANSFQPFTFLVVLVP